MYKIAILGCENSHAKNFLNLIHEGHYPDIEVVGIYSNEPEAAQTLHESFGVYVMSDYDELVGKVDGIMITARHGDNHYKYAKPYLPYGIPMFIDKPITCSEDEAVEFMRDAIANKVRLCGGSTCAALPMTLSLADAVRNNECGEIRGGSLACPIQLDSPYGGFYFYAQHLVEIMLTVFGSNISSVSAQRHDGSLTFNANYGDFDVFGSYIEKAHYYTVSLYGAKSARAEMLTFTHDSFRHEMDDMLDLLKGLEMKKSYESFITPVFVINSIIRALESGKSEPINAINI